MCVCMLIYIVSFHRYDYNTLQVDQSLIVARCVSPLVEHLEVG